MRALLFFCILTILNCSFASIDHNKKHGGHGLFNSFDKTSKTVWTEGSKLAEQSIKHTKFTPDSKIDDTLVISITPSNDTDFLENSDSSKIRHSSLYLQPEPRGLQYMLNTADFNPFLGHFMKKRDLGKEFVNIPNRQGHSRCQEKFIMCVLRNKRNAYFLYDQTIPGSRGQAVLYDIPNVNQNVPGVPGNFGGQTIPGSRGQAVLYGVPNLNQNLPGVPGNFDGQAIPGSRGQTVPYGAPNNLPTQNVPDGSINYLYKSHGY